jgi:serine phosphatase RsbU (regulator of sigma subunit)/tetratricopeptide (TPR) repeat protein
MVKNVFIFLLFTFLTLVTGAQVTEIDSLKALAEHATTDTARIHQTIKYAGELTYSNPSEAKKLLDDCIKESTKLEYSFGEATALYSKAVLLAFQGQYELSLKCMLDASKIYQQLGNQVGYAKCLGGQGNIFYFMDNYSKAIEYYEESLKIYRKQNNTYGIASCISNLGVICRQLKNFEKALEYQLEGLKLEEKSNNKRGIAISHISLSDVLQDLKRFSEAKRHALLSIKYSKAINDLNTTTDGMLRLAECYRLTGQYDSAQYLFSETIKIIEKTKDLNQLANALLSQIKLYDTTRNYYNAYKSQKLLQSVKDSLLSKEETAQLVEMQTKFESEKKEKENLILISKNYKQKLLMLGLVLVIVLAFLFVAQILLSRRKLRLTHEKLLTLHHEVQQQKEEIETQAENLHKANEAIVSQKDQIERTHQKISDSIIYASFIQSAMLPSDELLSNYFKEMFILYKPRDVVSGDFYWFKEINGNYVFAVADCTGHGVPGALLSMMGISFLNDIVANTPEIKVSKILEELRQNVKLALGQFSNKSLRKEGIEIGLFSYNPEQGLISFSGAYLSIWLCRNNRIKEYKSDRMSIGISLKEKPFTTTEFKVEKDDIIYLFTDGFADQIGGPNGKKFLRRNFLEEISKMSSLTLTEQHDVLEKTHNNWRGEKFDQIDDILVIGIKI